MLTLFPRLLDYVLIAPFLLRISLVIVLISCSKKTIQKDECGFLNCWKSLSDNKLKSIVAFQVVIALMLLVGAYTQVAALLAISSAVIKEYILKSRGDKCSDFSTLILFVAICLSLLVLGPGIFSLDLPL